MKRILAFAALSLVAGCVPATEETAPRGAVAFTTRASPGARGESFVTSDGWTVHLDVFAVAASFYVRSENMQQAQVWLFQPSHPIESVIPGMPAGLVDVQVSVWNIPLDIGAFHRTGQLDPGIAERFGRPSEDAPERVRSGGPGAYFKGEAARGGRVVTFDLSLQGSFARSAFEIVTVVANTAAPCEVLVKPESLFTNAAGQLVFDDLAATDRDGDGVLTVPELKASRSPPNPSKGIDFGMLLDLNQRFKGLFVVNSNNE